MRTAVFYYIYGERAVFEVGELVRSDPFVIQEQPDLPEG